LVRESEDRSLPLGSKSTHGVVRKGSGSVILDETTLPDFI